MRAAMTQPMPPQAPPRTCLALLYFTEAMQCIGCTLISVGIFFYTKRHLGWTLRENFLLALGEGAVYIAGALLARRLAGLFGRRNVLMAVNALGAMALLPAAAMPQPAVMTLTVVAYMFLSAISWPIIESLVSWRADAHEMSRRLGIYNMVWSLLSTVTAAGAGAIIDLWRPGLFVLPAAMHLIGVAALHLGRMSGEDAPAPVHSGPAPEHALLARRRLAMWLSRISLPATYVVVYSMMAMMPMLPVMQKLPLTLATPAASVWLLFRWLAFLVLAATVWWHTRPYLLLWSSAAMLVAFLGVVLPGTSGAQDILRPLAAMMLAQALLGLAIGMIYSGSLYFGMVLSDGSTEHGGYHEALIGLGQMLGPGAGALTQWLFPGDLHAAIVAAATVIALAVAATATAAVRAGRART